MSESGWYAVSEGGGCHMPPLPLKDSGYAITLSVKDWPPEILEEDADGCE